MPHAPLDSCSAPLRSRHCTAHLAVTECLRGDVIQIRRGAPPANQHLPTALDLAPKAASHEETKDESKYSSNSNQATHHRTRPASRTRRNLRAGRRCGSTDFAMAVTLHQRQTWEWVSLNTNTGPRKNRCQRPDCSEKAARSKRRHSACAGSLEHKMTKRSQRCRLAVRTVSQARPETFIS